MMTAAIEAHENREMAIVDIPNAFHQTEHQGETFHMKIRCKLAEILVSVAPQLHWEFVTQEKPAVCVKLLKALVPLVFRGMKMRMATKWGPQMIG